VAELPYRREEKQSESGTQILIVLLLKIIFTFGGDLLFELVVEIGPGVGGVEAAQNKEIRRGIRWNFAQFSAKKFIAPPPQFSEDERSVCKAPPSSAAKIKHYR